MENEILNMEQAAELFGVSIKTFIKLLKEEKVPARKIGREWRFSRKALIDWLSSGDSQIYSSSEGDTREFFDQVATEWDSMRRDYYDESVVNRLVELHILKPGMTVMDLGAGDGYLSRTIAGFVEKVVAVDISAGMLKTLEEKALQQGIGNIRTLVTDGQDMPVADTSIDLVCANMYLHHIEEPVLAIKEMHRVLKTGGTAFLADFNFHSNNELKEKMHDTWPGFKKAEIRALFQNAGFNGIHLETVTYEPPVTGKKSDLSIFILTAQKK